MTHITNGATRRRHIEQTVDAVRRILRVLRVAEQQAQQASGISAAQMFALQQLAHDSPLSLTELAERTLTDRSSVTDVVARLVARRLARRVRDPGDARRAAVSITARGRALVRRAAPSPARILASGLRDLTPGQLGTVSRSLARLSRALEPRRAAQGADGRVRARTRALRPRGT